MPQRIGLPDITRQCPRQIRRPARLHREQGGSAIKTILVATDGSDHAQRALDLAADIAVKYDGTLILLHVMDTRSTSDAERHMADVEFADRLAGYGLGGEVESTLGMAGIPVFLRTHSDRDAVIKKVIGEGVLDQAAAHARALGVRSVETVLETGDPAHVVVATAEARGANLIVIGSRGLSDLRGLLLGSVSHKVNHLSGITVVTVR
jgi:nucleotide-binding universal stress UspA family protein